MKKIGCRPPYWDVQDTLPDCNSHDQLRSFGKHDEIPADSLAERVS